MTSLEHGTLGRPCLGDGQFLLLGMLVHLGPAATLRLQPTVQLLEAGKAKPGLEETATGRLHLVLDLALLPAGRRRACRRLDHVVVRHDEEAPVEDALLAGEHRRHRRFHVVVNPACRHAAEKGERPRMRVEKHLLAFARIRSHIDRARRAQPHVSDLHPHRLAGDLDVLVAPVELIGFARPEHQRDEGRRIRHAPAPLQPPPRSIATDRVVRPVEPLAQQQVVDARDAQLLSPRSRLVFFKQHIQPRLKRTQLRQRLHRAPIREFRLRLADRLAHHPARQMQVSRYRLHGFPRRELAPDLQHRFQYQHPDLAA